MNRLKECREAAHLSQKYVALTLGIASPSISNWESGKTKPKLENLTALAELYGVSADYLLGREEQMPNNIIPVDRKRIPLLGKIAAGIPTYADEQQDEYVIAGDDEDVDFALEVDGDSMEPRLKRGDIVFFRAQEDVDDGKIAAVVIDDEATLKHVYHTKDGIQLVSDNHKYAPMLFREGVRILGEARYYRRRL